VVAGDRGGGHHTEHRLINPAGHRVCLLSNASPLVKQERLSDSPVTMHTEDELPVRTIGRQQQVCLKLRQLGRPRDEPGLLAPSLSVLTPYAVPNPRVEPKSKVSCE
jgi:hypothetical protein